MKLSFIFLYLALAWVLAPTFIVLYLPSIWLEEGCISPLEIFAGVYGNLWADAREAFAQWVGAECA